MPEEIVLLVDDEAVPLRVARDGEEWRVSAGRHEVRARLAPLEPGVFTLTTGGRTYLLHAVEAGERRALHVGGRTLEYRVERRSGGRRRDAAGSADLSAPMPGLVTGVLVREGDPVRPGQALVIVEAMKMEHVIRAARAGIVRRLLVRPGQQVEGGAAVAEIAPPP